MKKNKDMYDKLVGEWQDGPPLYNFIKKAQINKTPIYTWIKEVLWPYNVDPIAETTIDGYRICPHFIHCGSDTCIYFKPRTTDIAVVYCQTIKEQIILEEVEKHAEV